MADIGIKDTNTINTPTVKKKTDKQVQSTTVLLEM